MQPLRRCVLRTETRTAARGRAQGGALKDLALMNTMGSLRGERLYAKVPLDSDRNAVRH